ncbi:hypothetical protein HYPSUDRAFT_44795 [Hypholoma sublateritium FD-334 SS-4]|uniref:Glycoside hydrolase family 16 protein n=1 Tax=Hypholoma sublateritium (strain FD-334 SS-4) TaxID=945553 RepID=A0A0D2NQ85_HYPSF|nr:hypothetical protein HYPSUDRAFT_44795 [Hypholoma sublateritium FD-334 SS-4]
MTSSPIYRTATVFLILTLLGSVLSKPVRTFKQFDIRKGSADIKRRGGGGNYNGPSGTWRPGMTIEHSQWTTAEQYTTTGFWNAPAKKLSPTPAGSSGDSADYEA